MEEIIFPNQIRMIRRMRGKTMKEVAGILGVSLSAISKIEKGYRRIDEEQLGQIVQFLDCPKESVFVYEKTSQPEVIQAWKKEQERRKQINEKSGLKTLGAGLRYIRGEKMLTLQDVAKGAGLTLSVYHRIEMGQREVTEDQFKKIAHALGHTPESLQISIYELDMAGSLQDFKKTNKAGIFHSKGGYNDLPMSTSSLHISKQIPVLGVEGKNGTILIDNKSPINHVDTALYDVNTYAIQLLSPRLGDVFPMNRTILFVDKAHAPKSGDMAVRYVDENTVELGFVKGDKNTLVFVQYAPDKRTSLSSDDVAKMHKISHVHIA